MSESILDQLVEQWEQDAIIDKSNISGEILRTPNLFAKYLRILASWKQKRTALKLKYTELVEFKTRYYSGECSLEELQARGNVPQWQGVKLLKSQLQNQIELDSEVAVLQSKIEMADAIVATCEQILTSIKSRDFLLNTYTKYQVFLAGSN